MKQVKAERLTTIMIRISITVSLSVHAPSASRAFLLAAFSLSLTEMWFASSLAPDSFCHLARFSNLFYFFYRTRSLVSLHLETNIWQYRSLGGLFLDDPTNNQIVIIDHWNRLPIFMFVLMAFDRRESTNDRQWCEDSDRHTIHNRTSSQTLVLFDFFDRLVLHFDDWHWRPISRSQCTPDRWEKRYLFWNVSVYFSSRRFIAKMT